MGHAQPLCYFSAIPVIRIILRKIVSKLLVILLLPLGLLLTCIIRIIRPWLLIRIRILISERIGHFAANTELYLCECDAGIHIPKRPYLDLWYFNWPICNRQLARMWKRILHIGPSWLLAPTDRMNALIPNGRIHQIGQNTCLDRDVHNLLDQFPPHLRFLPEEEQRGQTDLSALGIPKGVPFVCLCVRDSSYLDRALPWKKWNYHSFRDCNIQNYVLAAEVLANRGYYVIRMGAVVKEKMKVSHPMIIDYAAAGIRTDFMDVYLGANCMFCITSGVGFDAIPFIFRRPIVYIDLVPMGAFATFSSKFIATTRKYWLRDQKRFMTIREIFDSDSAYLCYSKEYRDKGIDLIESAPEEIAAAVLEMEGRLKGTWQTTEEDEQLQSRFWEIFPKTSSHGEIRSRVAADFLRRNKALLE